MAQTLIRGGNVCAGSKHRIGRPFCDKEATQVAHRSPVELDVVVSGEREHHASHRWLFPLAHEVEVKHALW